MSDPEILKQLPVDETAYQDNIEFWERAWNMVKVPYTQLPQLSYIPRIPRELANRRVKRVLDLGCGSGWLSVYLAREGFEVVGVDVSAQAINLAKMWALDENLPISFDVSDIAALSYSPQSFDAVVANSIFEHFPLKTARTLAQTVHSLLKEGGVFLGCFDQVGGGPGEFVKLEDGTQVYTDKARRGMMLRRYSELELKELFSQFASMEHDQVDAGSNFVVAVK